MSIGLSTLNPPELQLPPKSQLYVTDAVTSDPSSTTPFILVLECARQPVLEGRGQARRRARKLHPNKAPGGPLSREGGAFPQSLAPWRPSHAGTWLVTTAVTLQTLTHLILGGTNLFIE